MDAPLPSNLVQNSNEKPIAPFITISQDPVICVEHPCIIKNVDRGIKSLGGEYGINKVGDDFEP
jgi:general transcription factor 3C polypeptide 5 (transcription factor C subunit 1)